MTHIDPTEYPQKTLAKIWMHERAPGPPTIDHDPRAFHRSGLWLDDGRNRHFWSGVSLMSAWIGGAAVIGYTIGWLING